MRGNVDTIKERLDITEVISGYLKLEKAGQNYKAKCPFHNEKTPSFFISPGRQGYYCFGCGAKGDMFNFVEEMEGVDFRGALKILADKAGVELEYQSRETKTEKEEVAEVVERATEFFEKNLTENKEALAYLESRGVNKDSIKKWRLGYVPDEWRLLFSHLTSLGYKKELLIKAGLVKNVEGDTQKNPYDVFRGRIIFPLFDRAGGVIAFSGRALGKGVEPKYLNSPDNILFNKSEVLYGLDRAKEDIRKKNYAVLVEGQLDLVLSHQVGVSNTVASSGTAFTPAHLERLKKLSSRIILAFDGDAAGEKAAEKSTELGLSLGMEVKVAPLPEGRDPADLIKEDPNSWKDVLRKAMPSVEFFLDKLILREKDARKLGKLVEKKILPMVSLVQSAIERAHFVSVIAKRTGIKEEVIWEDLRKVKMPSFTDKPAEDESVPTRYPRKTNIERRLLGIIFWQESLPQPGIDVTTLSNEFSKRVGSEYFEKLSVALGAEKDSLIFEAESYYSNPEKLNKDITELLDNLSDDILRDRVTRLMSELAHAESVKDEEKVKAISQEIKNVHSEIATLEDKKERV